MAALLSPTALGLTAGILAAGTSLASIAAAIAVPVVGGMLHLKSLRDETAALELVDPPPFMCAIFEKMQNRLADKKPLTIRMAVNEQDRSDEYLLDKKDIIIGEDVVRRIPADELEFDIAHEIGHAHYPHEAMHTNARTAMYILHDSLSLKAMLVPVGIMAIDKGAVGALGFVCAYVGALVAQALVVKDLSRREEYACDEFAVRLTGNTGAAIRSLERDMNEHDKKDIRNWIPVLDTHPTSRQRIRAIEAMQP